MRGYLIEKYNKMTGAYTCNRLVEEAKKQNVDLRIIGVHDCQILAEGISNAGKILEPVDFVINRYKWGKIKDRINDLGKRSYNELEAYRIYINKYEQVRNLRSNAFCVPAYVLGTALTPFKYLASTLKTPFVAKGLESSMGLQIRLIECIDDMERLRIKYGSEKEWLFEEMIHTSYGKDMRFYSIRGKAVAAMERQAKGDFRANVALGASVRKLEITPFMEQAAADIYRQTGLDFLGVDLLYGEDKPWFCEINVMPGIEGIEKASGENIAGKIIETIREDMSH